MKTIKALIIDDEEGCIDTLCLLLKNYHPDVSVIGTATSVKHAIKLIEALPDPVDLVFLDIQMPGGDGFTFLQHFTGNIPFRVIFTTAYDVYAIKAIRFSAMDYLLKPIDNNELKLSLDKFRNFRTEAELKLIDDFRNRLVQRNLFEKLAVSTINDIVLVRLDQILYLESDSNYTSIHLENSVPLISSKNIGYFQDLLQDSGFFRIHNSYLVNLKKVSRYIRGGSGMVEMEDGTKLLVSTRRKEEFVKNISII